MQYYFELSECECLLCFKFGEIMLFYSLLIKFIPSLLCFNDIFSLSLSLPVVLDSFSCVEICDILASCYCSSSITSVLDWMLKQLSIPYKRALILIASKMGSSFPLPRFYLCWMVSKSLTGAYFLALGFCTLGLDGGSSSSAEGGSVAFGFTAELSIFDFNERN